MIRSALKSILGLQKPTHLTVGAAAPALDIADGDGRTWSLADLRGRPFVLYFYPKDDTPGCTREACAFRDLAPRLDATILGVSTDASASHVAFARKYNLSFPLLADTDGTLSRRWGVLDGGVSRRVTFVVNAEGKIRSVFDPVRVDGHAAEVSAALQALS